MKKRVLSILLTVCMVLTLLPGFTQPALAAANGSGITGAGTSASPYIITNADQLAYVAQQVNNKEPGWNTASYKLGNDINLSSYTNWEPIGISNAAKGWPEFEGTFDGMGFTISNLTINLESSKAGLFGSIRGATVRNIALTNVSVTATNKVSGEGSLIGAFAGWSNGTVENCSVTGNISGTSEDGFVSVGGIIARNNGTIRNCYSTASVNVTVSAGTSESYGGGIAGENSNLINNCYSTSVVTLTDHINSNSKVGGISTVIFSNDGIKNCYWQSDKTAVGIAINYGTDTETSNRSFTGSGTLASAVTIGGISYSTLLGALNARVDELASTDLKTWTSEPYPVFSTAWVPPTYDATVTVQNDGTAWTDVSNDKVVLSTSDTSATTNQKTGNASSGEISFSGLDPTTTYYVWAKNNAGTPMYTGSSVSSTNPSAAVNYYTLTLTAGTGISSTTGGGNCLPGDVAIDAVLKTGYEWSKWVSGVSEQTAKSTSITMPAAPVTWTATATPIQYNITYTLNGGTVSTANPATYTVESPAIILNNPTRTGYSFVGWTGSNSGTAQPSVTIAAGSTGNKSYTANWKADKPALAPDSSIVTEKTDRSITIKTQSGYEYKVDGSDWKSGTGSYTFTDLTPGSTYNLVYRVAAVTTGGSASAASDASDGLTVTTKYAPPSAPSLSFSSISSTSVTIAAISGAEYSKDNGATWHDNSTFTGLPSATPYTFAIRIKETDDTVAGSVSRLTQYTAAAAPDTGVGYTISYGQETISITAGYEVSSSDTFDTTMKIGDAISPNTPYYVRVKAIEGGAPASVAVSFTLPERPDAPTEITADKTKDTITVTAIANQEYKIDDGEWQVSGSFTTGLTPNTNYTVYARVKATETTFASESYSINVQTKSAGSVTAPEPGAVTYDPDQTLAGITLDPKWVWSEPNTVPTVAISAYNAVYTPTDTDTVDYSFLDGYDNTDGTVTITRAIPLTVNRATPTAADFVFNPPESLDYSGYAKDATVSVESGIVGMGAITIKYYPGPATDAPINAGSYTVKIDIEEGENYAAETALTHSSWTFTIEKVPQEDLFIGSKPDSVTYGDTFTLTTSGGSGTGAVTWEVTEGTAIVDASGNVTITGIDETTITATKAADDNHEAAVTDTYTFTPAKFPLIIDPPSATGGWTKIYDGKTDFDKSLITVGGITNKLGSDDVSVTVQSAAYDTADIGSGNKTLTITYEIGGTDSGNYSAPADTDITTASITAATPTITLRNQTTAYTDSIIEIDEAIVTGATDGTTPDGAVTYTYYTKNTCTDADKTTVASGAETSGGAPKIVGTYYVKAAIAASGNYTAATSEAVTLTIYTPASGNSSAPVIVDGKIVDMGSSEVKDGATIVKLDQDKMSEQLKNASDSVLIPITSATNVGSAQLVVQNVESMAVSGMMLTVMVNDVSYEIPAESVDTEAILRSLGASDSSKVPLSVTISRPPINSITINDGILVAPPVSFTISATYNGKTYEVEKFESFVQRVIEIPDGVDPKTITTAVVVEADGTQRHVPTYVYPKGGRWYVKINSLTNSTYALIQSSASFTDTADKWYKPVAAEMASRKIISGIGENLFAGERSITRAEFAAILVRALGLPADGTSSFSDVPSTAWYSGAVATAVQYGLVTGVGENRFNPNASLTRQQAMLMLQRAAALTGFVGSSGALDGFTDAESIGSWAEAAAKWSVGSGLIQGANGKLNPTANITRAESAAVILRLLQKSGLVDVRS